MITWAAIFATLPGQYGLRSLSRTAHRMQTPDSQTSFNVDAKRVAD